MKTEIDMPKKTASAKKQLQPARSGEAIIIVDPLNRRAPIVTRETPHVDSRGVIAGIDPRTGDVQRVPGK
ncbi:MAG TPA: hypothetical protein VFB62_26720 [Polyangiaceae bacterium]|nr:hypothetical protein [Polyangiaceae bacterium]